jgi:hypothetical protein
VGKFERGGAVPSYNLLKNLCGTNEEFLESINERIKFSMKSIFPKVMQQQGTDHVLVSISRSET